jgi:hypothetical protein
VLEWLSRVPLPEALALAWRYSYGVRFVIMQMSDVQRLMIKQWEYDQNEGQGDE